jgi:tRNA U34 5-carboxymethylaminomethyl modifying GTPase MnmE/TrmE
MFWVITDFSIKIIDISLHKIKRKCLTSQLFVPFQPLPEPVPLAVIRLSGSDAVAIADSIFRSPKEGKKLEAQPANTLHFGKIVSNGQVIDEVVVGLFRHPIPLQAKTLWKFHVMVRFSFSKSCLKFLLNREPRLARPGEFTQRAFLMARWIFRRQKP